MAYLVNHYKYSDLVIQSRPEGSTDIHIDMTDETIGGNFFLGWLAHYLMDKYGVGQHGKKLEEMSKENVNFVIDNIQYADSNSLLNPGVLIMFGNELCNLPKNWGITITKAITW